MARSAREIVEEGRSLLQEAAIRMDEGEYGASAEACVRASSRALEGMLLSWEVEPADRRCRRLLEAIGRETPGEPGEPLRECCRKIDRHAALYGGEAGGGGRVGEERAMELINYGREVLRFVQRNLRREEGPDADSPGRAYRPQSRG